jgi:beta-ketoacyl-acyl-carrier-protein synthase II
MAASLCKEKNMSENRRVVITGVGAITPLGNNVTDTWENMKNGKNGIAPITLFDTEKFKAKLGAEVKGFDPKEYLEVNDVLRTDRYAQFAVAAAQQAVEESGITGTVIPERFAVIFGTGIGGIGTFETEYTKLIEKGPRRVSPLFIPMMIGNMAAGMIAIRHDCRGAAMPAVTACASGSNAIGEAMRLIRHGYADAVITGGAEAAIVPSAIAGFVNMQALSTSEDPDAASLPFDKRRGGFVIGEGAACLILEEYEHAKARGAKIYGEVCGYGVTCDAYHITAPRPDARGGAQAMMDAMREAGYTDRDIVYVNAHGTGTPMNDVLETAAIKKALGEDNAKKAYVSSTKSMTGHMLGAAGAIEALACLFALNEGIIPPTINLREQDEACDLNCVPNTAAKAGITLALSNSLGFGGHNACLAFRKV